MRGDKGVGVADLYFDLRRSKSQPVERLRVIGTRISVGRGKASAIQLFSSGVSRRHAVFELRERVWYLKDLGSSNGTFLNGDRISLAEVRPRDMILFGGEEALMRIRALDPPPPASMGDETRDVMFGPSG
jgi:pSer/pThr/pTyr-binding forkhead associated (FHA) protein